MPNSPRSPILSRNSPRTRISSEMPTLNSPRSPKNKPMSSPKNKPMSSPKTSPKMSASNKLKKKK